MIRLLQQRLHRVSLQRMGWDLTALLTLSVVLPAVMLHEPLHTLAPLGGILAVGMLVMGNASGFYARLYARPFSQTFARCVLALVGMVALYVAATWVATWAASNAMSTDGPMQAGDQEMTQAYAMLAAAAVMMWRTAAAHLSPPETAAKRRVLVLGTGRAAHLVHRTLQTHHHDVHVVGHVCGPIEHDSAPAGLKMLSSEVPLAELADRHRVDEVLVALSERRGGATPLQSLLDCRIKGVEVHDINTHFERHLGQVRLEHLSAHWLIFGDGFRQGVVRRAVKRVFDLVMASLLLVPGVVLMALAAVAVKLESAGPVLYRQQRIGLGGRVFEVIKLRSMRLDAEHDGKPRWATANDSRVTHVGRFIRATRIDELPQLLNVLRGEMSMVGPRPERPYFVDQLSHELPFYTVRHSVKPGITGWAQVRCDYGSTVDEARNKLQFDLYYVKNNSLMLDVLVMLETVGVVLTGKGAR